jgi:hypothetical protein
MTAKSKAFQAMAVIGIAAVTYTVYNSASTETATKAPAVKEQQLAPVIVTAKPVKQQKPVAETQTTQATIPGYSNPDESGR